MVDASGVQSGFTTVALTVDGINDAPDLQQDNPQLNPQGSTVIRVLDNDTDVDGFIVPGTVQILLPPAFGSAEVQPDGTIVYIPFGGSATEDVFTYTVADNLRLRSDPAFVTISTNASPIAVNDGAVTYLDESLIIDVAGNDSDPDGELDLGSIEIVTDPLRGNAVPLADGTVQYVPNPGYLGRDSFQYVIFDTLGRVSNLATVSLEVNASRLQNPQLNADVNDDGAISALDSLLVINRLAAADGAASIPVLPGDRGPNFYDVNGNQQITASDALAVINELSRINNGSQVNREAEVVPLPSDANADALLLIDTQSSAPIEDLSAPEKIVGSVSIESVLSLIHI